MTTVVIASYFEDEFVQRIRELDGRLRVLYRENLVPPEDVSIRWLVSVAVGSSSLQATRTR